MDDLVLMLRGEARWCADCEASTIFVPVPESRHESWCCTACDAAVVVTTLAA